MIGGVRSVIQMEREELHERVTNYKPPTISFSSLYMVRRFCFFKYLFDHKWFDSSFNYRLVDSKLVFFCL